MKHVEQVAVRWDGTPWADRLAVMSNIADEASEYNPFRIWVVNHILKPAGVASLDYVGQARALYDWAKANIYYVNEAGEHLQNPVVTAEEELGDCDDFSMFLRAAARSIGLPSRFVLAGPGWESRTGLDLPEEPTHVYIEIGSPALSPMSEATHVSRVAVSYRAADPTDAQASFGDRVSLGQPRRLTRAGARGMVAVMIVIVALLLWRIYNVR